MDVADEAFLETESRLSYILHVNKGKRYSKSVKPEGFCHYCEDEVVGEKLFCDGKCATLFERKK